MRIVRSTCAYLALLTPVIGYAAAPAPSAAYLPSDPTQLTASFSVTAETSVPGKVLKPGSYTIRVVDHLSDRIVLRIEDPQGKPSTTFLGLPASGLGSAGSGPVAWTNSPKGSRALRGFAFAGGNSVEFVYPKDEAVAIAKVNTSKVAAIDPSSDNLPANKDLSKEDMQMVTLWSLSSTRVGPNDKPAIQAEHYKAPEPTQVAEATPPSPMNQERVASRPARAAATAPVATVHRPSVVARLPRTASNLPTLMLLTLLSFLAAAGLRFGRVQSGR